MTDLSEGMQAMASPDEPGARVAKQAETVRRSYEHAVTNMKELAEMIQHANADAMEVLNKRFIEAMEEVDRWHKSEGPVKAIHRSPMRTGLWMRHVHRHYAPHATDRCSSAT